MEAYKIGGAYNPGYDTTSPYLVGKGGGSAYGAQWKPNPNKPNEVILQGPSNTIQRYFLKFKGEGYWVQVKYGADDWATKIRHETKHYGNELHTNPHDHIIEYDIHTHSPIFVKPQINYPEEQYPNGAPEFKCLCNGVIKYMELICNEEEMRFKTISEFKNSLERGGEIVIEWKDSKLGIFIDGKTYCITSGDGSVTDYDSIDELLERYICGDRLRDVITQVTVMDRAL